MLFLFLLLFGWLVLMHPEVTVFIFSTQKLPGLCYFLRLMETQAWGASNCGQRGESRDLIFRISSITCNRNSLKTAKMSSDGISKLPIEKFKPWSPYLSLQGKTWSEMFLGQNTPPEAGRPTQLLDGNKISFCIIYFGISISSRGLLSAFLFVSVCGQLLFIFPCRSVLGRAAGFLFHGGPFQTGPAVSLELGQGIGKESCLSPSCSISCLIGTCTAASPTARIFLGWSFDNSELFHFAVLTVVFLSNSCIKLCSVK